MESKRFLSTATLVGMLTGHTKNGLNLINAPSLAKDAGIEVSQTYEGSSETPTVTIAISLGKGITHSVRGESILCAKYKSFLLISYICRDILSYYQIFFSIMATLQKLERYD